MISLFKIIEFLIGYYLSLVYKIISLFKKPNFVLIVKIAFAIVGFCKKKSFCVSNHKAWLFYKILKIHTLLFVFVCFFLSDIYIFQF